MFLYNILVVDVTHSLTVVSFLILILILKSGIEIRKYQPKMLPASSLYVMCFLTTSVVHYHRRSHSRGKASRRRSVLSCLKGWKLPPYLLHPTKPSNCIYVKKTPEQCYLGSRNSQKVWGNVWWDKHSRVAYVINKWRAKINRKRLYNVRNPLEEREDLRIGGENTVAW